MNIMSKGIATETVLYLLVGIVVVGILIFLVYKYVLTSSMSADQCKGVLISWCTSCKLACTTADWSTACGTDPGTGVSGDTGCAEKYFGFTITSDDKCKGHKSDCSAFIETG